jgi:DNA mismatch repair protein MutS2
VIHALQVLEFGSVKERLARHSETSIGAALASQLEPSFDSEEVWARLSDTKEAHDLLSGSAPPSLGAVRDLRESLHRASKGAVLGGQELYVIGETLQALRSMKRYMQGKGESRIQMLAATLPQAEPLEKKLFDSLEGSGEVRSGASDLLASLRQRKATTTSRIMERIQSYVSGKHRDLLSDPIYTVREGRYVIPVKAENKHKVKGIVHDTSGSGQTVYVEPEDVLQLGNQLREVEGQEREEIVRILRALSGQVGALANEISAGIETAGELDFILSKAKLGFEMKAGIPLKSGGHGISVRRGFHPLLDRETAVPLDIELGFEHQSVLITGPNTGGKTVAIKTVGLFVLMAQAGLMLPAGEVRLGPFTQVWADIGDEQSLQQSLSTFSGHIKNIAEALTGLREGALVLLDEIGAGTDPAEGAALAKAILSEMQAKGARVLASTHYGELKAFAYNTPGFHNAAMEFDAKSLRPTYRLIMGAPGASHALRIAERYGIPKDLIERAREGLGEAAQDVAKMLEQLEHSQRQARQAQSEADRRSSELRKAEETAARKLKEADEIRRTAHAKAHEAIEDALREIRKEAAEVFESLKHSAAARDQESARSKLKQLQEVAKELADEIAPVQRQAPARPLKKGDAVKVEGHGQVGTLLSDPRDGAAQVQMGLLKLTVAVDQLQPAQAKPSTPPTRHTTSSLQKAQTARTEIHLRAMRAEDAERELESFLDDAVLGGLASVRIVHGKGEGILRNLTREMLRRHPHVKSFRDGEAGEGGHGVTIAVLG